MKIDTHTPINKTAALVTQQASDDNTFNAKQAVKYRGNDDYWKAPKACIKYNEGAGSDLTGFKTLRSVVIGYLGRGKFQLRCCCGNYYQRKANKIKSMKPINGICGECARRYDMMRHNDYLKDGHNKHDINWYVLNR